jgi:hypothetical protein
LQLSNLLIHNKHFRDSNTGKIEVGLVEEVYEDQDNTDKLMTLSSVRNAPFIISFGIIRDPAQDIIVIDCDD